MLKRNLISNYAGQIVTVVLGMVMVPVYVRHLGVEAYGLIAFNAVLIAWVQLLDLGLSPTLCRELARAGNDAEKIEARTLLQSLEKFVSAMCSLLIVMSFFSAPFFASTWLKAKALPAHEIEVAFVMMVLTVSARWLSSLYRGGMVGIDRQTSLNMVISIFAVIRAVLVVPLIAMWPRVDVFFLWQLAAIAGEALTMRVLLGRAIGASIFSRTFSREVLVSRARLSLSIAFSALMWATSTQADKIILSKILPLPAFGVFSMATLLASGILLLASPVQQSFTPKFTADSARDSGSLVPGYFLASEIMMIIVIPVAILFASVPDMVFALWSPSLPANPDALQILQCYALGNGCSAIAGLSFLIQYADGNLSLHIKGNLGFVAILVPAVVFGALHYGARGAAYTWLAVNVLQLFVWVAVVHRRFLPGINPVWYRGLMARIAVTALLGIGFHYAAPSQEGRITLFFMLLCMWLLMVAAAIAVSPISQRKARDLVGRFAMN
ncbi:flippase [Burkholderia ubonensis]|uniref:lipopolysaccharide biosynthesis protein n=1 Tax=Burkholderia ubonensis TaxID=101571 RepID=UPI0007597887|nr:oligosaccharide flippase family protein [Burkholderia ubonensis]KVD05554.1 flippase [Burkholderia ubonensis]